MKTNAKTNRIILYTSLLTLLLIGNINLSIVQSADDKERVGLKYPTISELSGEYIPKDDVIVGKYLITSFVIDTNPIDGFVCTRSAVDPSDDSHFIRWQCLSVKMNGKDIYLKTQMTKFGTISINGSFLPIKNDNWKEIYELTVFKGKITIENKGKIVYSKDHEFRYWGGD